MKRVAICVPTLNRSEIVDDVLKRSLHTYFVKDIDVYYLDSSEDNKTQEVVEFYQKKGYTNLYYKKVSSSYRGEEKLLMLFAQEDFVEEYQYIWPVKDRVYFSEKTIDRVYQDMEQNYDVILLGAMPPQGRPDIYTKVYTNAALFYRDWAWQATSLDVVIYNVKSMLSDFSVAEFKERYQQDFNIFWCHIVLLFNKLAEKESVAIKLFRDIDLGVYNSLLGGSTWKKNTFKIWKDYWISVNLGLPSCYNEYKLSVIKEAASLPWIMGSIEELIQLQKIGALTKDNFDQVAVNWNMVSDIPLSTVMDIAYGRYDVFHDISGVVSQVDEFTQLLIRLVEMIKLDQIDKLEIPFDEIARYIVSKGLQKLQEKQVKLILGSIKDIKEFISKDNSTKEDISKAMQLVINIIGLLG